MSKASYTPGRFVWHELFTDELAASKSFYTELFGWTINEVPSNGDLSYSMIQIGDTPIGGMMSLERIGQKGAPPYWLGYVSVPDVDEAAAAISSAGGKVLAGPDAAGDFGRFVVLQDPQGAVLAAWKAHRGDPPEPTAQPPVGHFCWDQLMTRDIDAAAAFYGKVFAWSRGAFDGNAEMPVFARGDDKWAAGAALVPEGLPPHWMCHVRVATLADARAKAEQLGGTVLMAQIPVPNIGTFAVINDNAGATIALFEGSMA